jgi:hypothetical protein
VIQTYLAIVQILKKQDRIPKFLTIIPQTVVILDQFECMGIRPKKIVVFLVTNSLSRREGR